MTLAQKFRDLGVIRGSQVTILEAKVTEKWSSGASCSNGALHTLSVRGAASIPRTTSGSPDEAHDGNA